MPSKRSDEIDEELETDMLIAEQEAKMAAAQAAGNQGFPLASLYGSQQKQNLVEWQLDFKPELLAVTRTLRNDICVLDNRGKENWIKNPDPDKVLLNELGVNDVLKKIILLINKNKVLSNYGEDQIRDRIKAISHAIRELIYLNYEHYGMDNEYKWNCYYSLVIDINDMIESAYRRALNGEERKDLNQARVVEQKDPLMPQQNFSGYPNMPPQRRGVISRMMPWNWGGR